MGRRYTWSSYEHLRAAAKLIESTRRRRFALHGTLIKKNEKLQRIAIQLFIAKPAAPFAN